MKNDCFIAVYTNECKDYCDEKFFGNLIDQDLEDIVHVVDNTQGIKYYKRLKEMMPNVDHISINHSEERVKFLVNVCESVNLLRYKFLQSDRKYFIILESDVIPPERWLEMFDEVIDKADIIGGVYYKGVHPDYYFDNVLFDYVGHVLSGCTLYKRRLIEQFPFKWDIDNKDAFPDAHICDQAKWSGYKFGNYTKIKCEHLHKENGSRGQEDIK